MQRVSSRAAKQWVEAKLLPQFASLYVAVLRRLFARTRRCVRRVRNSDLRL